MNCNDCGGFLPGGCECNPFGGRSRRALTGAQPAPAAPSDKDADHAAWLADKIVAHGDYAKEAAAMLRRWPAPAAQPADSAMEVLRELIEAHDAALDATEIAPPPGNMHELMTRAAIAFERARALTAKETP